MENPHHDTAEAKVDDAQTAAEAKAQQFDEQQKAVAAGKPLTLKLKVPIEFGKELIEELTLKPHPRALRELELQMGKNGEGNFFVFKPYSCALVGMRMAGHFAAAQVLVDKMDGRDLFDLGMMVFTFFV